MLVRSPKSKLYIASSWIFIAVIIFIVVTSTLKIYRFSNSFGQRKIFFVLNKKVNKGDLVSNSNFTKREIFSNDVPKGTLTQIKPNSYFKLDLQANTLITNEMITQNISDLAESNKRIVFIPTKEPIMENISNFADILSTPQDGFSSALIAENVKILFGLNKSNVQDQGDKGFFVEVNQEEAAGVVEAIDTGSVHLAIIGSNK